MIKRPNSMIIINITRHCPVKLVVLFLLIFNEADSTETA
jgi:hypothetical protein